MTLKGGNSKGKILRKKDRKHTFDQEKKKDSRKKERKHANDQEKKVINQDLDHAIVQEKV